MLDQSTSKDQDDEPPERERPLPRVRKILESVKPEPFIEEVAAEEAD